MSDDFRSSPRAQIEEFKAEYRARFPGRDAETLTDEDLMREVMNTVGKAGKLGEHVKCVVSVSMLTEGWDANTVTHILGVRAFGTQLLCEQVVGRGLRRMSFAAERPRPLRAGIRRSLRRAVLVHPVGTGRRQRPHAQPKPGRVRGRPKAAQALEITFPRVLGYRYDLPPETLDARFTDESRAVLSTADIPTKPRTPPSSAKPLPHPGRPERTAGAGSRFRAGQPVLETYFRDDDRRTIQALALPATLLGIVRQVLAWSGWRCVCKDDTFPQMLLFDSKATRPPRRSTGASGRRASARRRLQPVLQPYDTDGSTATSPSTRRTPIYAHGRGQVPRLARPRRHQSGSRSSRRCWKACPR